jgi:hypothetical protein
MDLGVAVNLPVSRLLHYLDIAATTGIARRPWREKNLLAVCTNPTKQVSIGQCIEKSWQSERAISIK